MDSFDLETSLGFLLNKANAAMRGRLNAAIKEAGLEASSEQWGLLNIIRESPGLSQSEIAARSLKDKTTVTRILDALERRGLIERAADPSDRRRTRIYLTGEGEALRRALLPSAVATNAEALGFLSETERRRLFATLRKITTGMKGGLA